MKNQLIFAPHAIDNNRFTSNEILREKALVFRNKLNIKETDFIFLFAGKIESNKNPELLLDAFLSASFDKNVHLVFVGGRAAFPGFERLPRAVSQNAEPSQRTTTVQACRKRSRG
jgi:glycosyltransferase involved in cell wall biosynthesis